MRNTHIPKRTNRIYNTARALALIVPMALIGCGDDNDEYLGGKDGMTDYFSDKDSDSTRRAFPHSPTSRDSEDKE